MKSDKIGRNGYIWCLALLMLIVTGAVYRAAASRLQLIGETPITLERPLRNFPLEAGDWSGKDIPIPTNIQRIARNDDYLYRLYINKKSNEWANVYVAYTARPRTMVGHRPETCYVGGGWVHDSTQKDTLVLSGGKRIAILIHRFHRPAPEIGQSVVLNFYIVNGAATIDESVFSGIGWRTPNIGGNAARYITQVEISSVLEHAVRSTASEIIESLFDFFPDEQGRYGLGIRDKVSETHVLRSGTESDYFNDGKNN